MSDLPTISIVTPSYNQAQYLEETIDSILSQNYPNLEYVIIDGGSNDGSPEIIKKYEKHLKYWVSESDKGQSDAINKGIAKLSGDVFNWINSDDILLPDSLKNIGVFFSDPEVSCVKGNIQHIINGDRKNFVCNIQPDNVEMLFCDPIINQQSTFYRLDFVKEVGGVNSLLHYSMDYELWLKFLCFRGFSRILFTELYLSGFRLHEDAKTSLAEEIFRKDIANILMSAAEIVEGSEVKHMLSEIYKRYDSYSLGINKTDLSPELLKKMAAYFLVKWHRFPKEQSEMKSLKYLKEKFDKSLFIGEERWWLDFQNNFTFKSRLKRAWNKK